MMIIGDFTSGVHHNLYYTSIVCRNASIDSYRALVLHPTWEKPYYRCAEALHRLGEMTYAIEVNELGQILSTSSADLCSQLNSFTGLV